MAEMDYSPLSSACFRALCNKMQDKRKYASLQIEQCVLCSFHFNVNFTLHSLFNSRMVRDFHRDNNIVQLQKMLKILGDLALSHNPNWRKGGLLGLAAVAIGLGKDSREHITDIIGPMLASFSDQDPRVRFYASEAVFNVCKVCREGVLQLFNELFNALFQLSADSDQSVRAGCEVLDTVIKDIVTESPAFDLVGFIPLLRDRLYPKNPFARQFIVSWVSLLNNVPDIDMIVFLPQLLDGLLSILSDQQPEIRRKCELLLNDFLEKITKNPAKADFSSMVNTLIVHSQSSEELVQLTALTWLKEFINLAGSTSLIQHSEGLLTAILPRLGQQSRPYSEDITVMLESNKGNTLFASNKSLNVQIREVAKALNASLMQLVTMEEQIKDETNPTVMTESSSTAKSGSSNGIKSSPLLNLANVVEVLAKELQKSENGSTATKLAVLKWIYHLHAKLPHKISPLVEQHLFPVLLKTLSDPSDDVVLLDLEILAEIFSSNTAALQNEQGNNSLTGTYFVKFMETLLHSFSTTSGLLEDRGSFIVRKLCVLMNAEDIYRSLSEILLDHEDVGFAYTMVQTLNKILLTSGELYDLRSQLRDLKTDESCSLFCCLYKTWCHSPVATVALCLLTKNYKHACDLLMQFGDLDVTVDFLTEIDQLVQLIESPIFAYLRLELLDVEHNSYLVKSLYGLLMLLPQGNQFNALRKRLQCVPTFKQSVTENSKRQTSNSPSQPKMDFKELLRRFKEVQQRHKNWKRSNYVKLRTEMQNK
ncbi:protein VAC14-like protein [Dinothrombium tinctorium]|uniref:Protein VAC14 homolog n=1 Tax=Dinothrombium tinctorium TaxID=1965070 RepID=A0A443QR17_9ACAR|nr:protein VAC14-like protein [Dinothrombium tinctorium]